jgi:gliding motility associated protien GldN
MKTICFFIGFSIVVNSFSQIPESGVPDGPAFREHIPTKRMIPYPHVREADIAWSKRVWRSIDLREKINYPLYYPLDEHFTSGQYYRNSDHWSLWTILREHILQGDLTLYSPYNPYQFDLYDGDQFKYPIRAESGKNYKSDPVFKDKVFYYIGNLGPETDIPISNSIGEDSTIFDPILNVEVPVYPPRDTTWIDSKDIIQYHVKEDWFFDKTRSVMDVRIVGIAPVVYKKENIGGVEQISGTKELFWIYFPHARYIFNKYFVFNDKNNYAWMSFDDYFWKRRFSSTIYKESNVYDRTISTYQNGTDALLESERINEEIRTIESDLWNF